MHLNLCFGHMYFKKPEKNHSLPYIDIASAFINSPRESGNILLDIYPLTMITSALANLLTSS